MHGYCTDYSVSAEEIRQFPGTWWAAMTRPQYENRLANELAAKEAYPVLPLVERVRFERCNGQKRRISAPLIPSYLFFCGDADHRYAASRSIATLQIIDVRDQSRFINELSAVVAAVESCPTLGVVKLGVGTEVKIVKGPANLLGQIGYVEAERAGVVHLRLTMLGQSVAFEMDPDAVEETGRRFRPVKCPSCGHVNLGHAARYLSYWCDQCGHSFTSDN